MKNLFIVGFMTVILAACASTTEKSIEEAQFMLDHGDFDGAIALMDPVVEAEPNNMDAKFILGSALIGNFALSRKAGCESTDVGYLGALACMLDKKDSTDTSGLKTFGRIAPDTGNLNDDIYRAVDILSDITKFSEAVPESDVGLQRLIARAFSLATIFEIAGANSSNVDCNAGGAGVDDVPDNFDSSNIKTADAERFVDDLRGIIVDSRQAGLSTSFGITTNAQNVLDDLDLSGVSTRTAVILLFEAAYNTPAKQVCN